MLCINRYVERLLDRINNGKLPDDRRNAITELQAVVSENKAFQLAFGAMGISLFSQANCFSFFCLSYELCLMHLCRFSYNVGRLKGRT